VKECCLKLLEEISKELNEGMDKDIPTPRDAENSQEGMTEVEFGAFKAYMRIFEILSKHGFKEASFKLLDEKE
jgi:hypothetical protein